MSREIQDMSLKFDRRIVSMQIFVNTDEDEHEVVKRTVEAAKGTKLRACVVGANVLQPGSMEFVEAVAMFAFADKTQKDNSIKKKPL